MWFTLGFKNFVAKNYLSDDFSNLFVSDFKRIWHKSLSNNELFSISQTLNPLLEAPVQKLRDVTLKTFQDETVQKEIKEEKNDIFLKLESNILGMKFQFQVLLNQGNGEMLYKELTIPLLLMIMNTEKKMRKLIEIIRDKDEEIKDYKQEFGIKSNCLATKPFNEKEFDCQDSASNTSSYQSSFFDCINASLLATETVHEIKSQEKSTEQKSERKHPEHFVDESDAMKSIFKDENLKQNRSVKSCVLLNNQIIKKRKKHNEGFRIKF